MSALPGTRVVVTRSSEDADSLGRKLEELGAEVIRLPTISIEFPNELLVGAEGIVADLRDGRFAWLIFSSSAGVRAFMNLLSHHGIASDQALGNVRIAAVGSATVVAVEEVMGRAVDAVPDEFTGGEVARLLGAGDGLVLLPRPEDAPRSIVEQLQATGWRAVELPLYRTVRGSPRPAAVERVRNGDFDVVTLTSGSTVRFFVELVGTPGELGLSKERGPRVVVIGPSTEVVARRLGFWIDAVADPHTTDGVVSAVVSVVGR